MKNKSSFSWDELLLIENRLNEIKFINIPVGGLFAHFLYTSLFFNNFNDSNYNKVKINLLLLREKIVRGDKTDLLPTRNGVYIFNYTGKYDKLLDFFRPLYPHFENSEIVFISKESEQSNELSGSSFIYPKNLSKRAKHEWKIHFKETEKSFNKLEPKLRELQISLTLIKYFRYCLIKQTQKLFFFLEYIEHSKPKAVLTDHDRQMINSSLVLAAKAKGVPTFTFIHGSTDPAPDFIPLLADYMLCWGQYHFQQFTSLGIPPEKLIIAGNPKISIETTINKEIIKEKLNLDNRLVAVFASNPINIQEKLELAEMFCSCISLVASEYKGIFKLHPNETLGDYSSLINKYPETIFLTSKDILNEEIFAIADLIVCHNSTIAIDALIKKIPVIITHPDFITYPLGLGEKLLEEAKCPGAKDTDKLINIFTQCVASEFRDNLIINSKNYIDNYCNRFDIESAKFIVEKIKVSRHDNSDHEI
ncbi:MAG: CDP-glycerol glycerophosphotransferase family protein [Sphingobacteriales bacterium]|jgi:hypothetical protein|nr:CDP-glycerol glycerophosphotransferase family protein [Sphingobacteriales bacterium]